MRPCRSWFRSGRSEFRCCLCCHVRTGTAVLGIWHLVFHILALAFLISAVFHPELVCNKLAGWAGWAVHEDPEVALDTGTAYTTAASTNSVGYLPPLPDFSAGGMTKDYVLNTRQWLLNVAILLGTGTLTILLLYGTIRGRPNCLMPFFCLQVFDFVTSALVVVGYLSYSPDMRNLIEESKHFPFQKELLQMDPQWLYALSMIVFVSGMMLKAYFMGVVWSCYKYLKMLTTTKNNSCAETDSEVLLPPPDYETATKQVPPSTIFISPPPYAASAGV